MYNTFWFLIPSFLYPIATISKRRKSFGEIYKLIYGEWQSLDFQMIQPFWFCVKLFLEEMDHSNR